jgi:anti-sigma factor RsiW
MADEINEQLTAYLDGELDSATAADVERKLREDPAYQREAETLKRTWELLDFLPQPEPSKDFASRTVSVVMPAIVESKSRSRKNRWPRRLGLAAAAVAIFLVGYAVPGFFFASPPKPMTLDQREEIMARDLRVIERLPMYQHADDLDFLMGLDSPDLFGD